MTIRLLKAYKGKVAGDELTLKPSAEKVLVDAGIARFTVTDNNASTATAAAPTSTMKLGGYHIWVDNTGRLRIKSGAAPTSATDGTVVGTQA